MKNKILCLTLIVSVLCSVFVISASAQDDYVIEAGTYTFNDVLEYQNLEFVHLPFTVTGFNPATQSIETLTFDTLDFDDVSTTGTPYYRLDYLYYGGSTLQNMTYAYSDVYGWNELYYLYLDILEDSGEPIPEWINSLRGIGQTITVTEDTSVDASFYTWFINSTSGSSSLYPLVSGYYRLILPIDIVEPTWIGDRNTVWYNMRGRVITEDSNRALSFYRLGISYFVNEGPDYGAGVWGIELCIDTNTDTNLEVLSITYDNNTNQFYWSYNDLVLDSFVGIALDGDYEVNEDFLSLFDSLFEPYEYVYTGNPWFDIVDGVVDALKIDVFGSFSPWDILVTFIGISVFIWLLKLLAGG